MSRWILDGVLSRLITRGTLTVTNHDGQVHSFGTPDPEFPDIAMRFTDAKVARDALLSPRLGFPEAYMDGRIVIERGDIMGLITLAMKNNAVELARSVDPDAPIKTLADRLLKPLRQFNRAASARSNVAHHYDLDAGLYDLFLDEDRQYSCAYWPREDMTLEEAQAAKKAHIAAKLALAPGHRVLDIGCGWGGMALYLHQAFGVEVTGITLSTEQLAIARQRAETAGVADKVRFELIDYRAMTGQFDRIVSVGMFEHVGVPQYRDFFRTCHNLLAPDGVMLIHTIGRMFGPGSTDAFTRKYIFPGGYSPALSEIVSASESNRLIVTDVETWRVHYAKTLRQWYARTLANREKIEALYDARFYRMWCFYLAGAATAFEYGGLVNYQLQFTRSRWALPLSRDYMLEGAGR